MVAMLIRSRAKLALTGPNHPRRESQSDRGHGSVIRQTGNLLGLRTPCSLATQISSVAVTASQSQVIPVRTSAAALAGIQHGHCSGASIIGTALRSTRLRQI